MKPCTDYLELMNAVLDGEATPAQEAELTAHLALCPACAALYEDLRALREGADGLIVPAPDGFADAVMAQVRAEAAAPKLKVLPKPRRKTWMPAAAMAAVCAIALLGSGALKYFQPHSGGSAAPAAAPNAAIMAAGGTVEHAPTAGQTEAQTAPAEAPTVYGAQSGANDVIKDGSPLEEKAVVSAAPWEFSASVSPASGGSARSAEDDLRPALDLVVERTYGESGYTMQTVYADDGLSCTVTLLDGETVIAEGRISYTGLSPNGKFYCFSWTWQGQSGEEADLFRYAVPLDLSYVMWTGDASDGGEGFRAALEKTD